MNPSRTPSHAWGDAAADRALPEWKHLPATTRHAYKQNRARIATILAQTHTIKPGDAAERYLRRQGVRQRHIPAALRLHPALEWWDVDARGLALCRGRFPALVASLQIEVFPQGPRQPAVLHTVALQRIYLDARGAGNEPVPAFIKTTGTTGDSRGAAIRLATPTRLDGSLTLGVAVGITAALRFAHALRMPVWAVPDAAALAHFRWPRGLQRLHVLADDLASTPARELMRKAVMCGLRTTGQAITPPHPAD